MISVLVVFLLSMNPSEAIFWDLLGLGGGGGCCGGYGQGGYGGDPFGQAFQGIQQDYGVQQGYGLQQGYGVRQPVVSYRIPSYVSRPAARPVTYIIRKKYYRPVIERTTVEVAQEKYSQPSVSAYNEGPVASASSSSYNQATVSSSYNAGAGAGASYTQSEIAPAVAETAEEVPATYSNTAPQSTSYNAASSATSYRKIIRS
uniref:Conserved secreted protein n=2 Tax=Bursaphelenchus xylophilus TaxID=6326 RepID=A0A1I7RS10_BURXY